MTQHETLHELVKALEDITSLMHYFADGNEIPEIERDIVKDKLRWVYASFIAIDSQPAPGIHIQKSEPEANNTAPPVENKSENSSDDKTENAPVQTKEIVPPDPVEENQKVVEFDVEPTATNELKVTDPEEEAQETIEEPMQEKGNQNTLADKFRTGQASVNEYMAKMNLRKDVASKLQGKPINDIHKAIGLNDKFQLINHLFKGDSNLYQKTIDRLNNAGSFNEAFLYIQDHFNWDLENELVQQILELARRKFINTGHE